MSIMCCAENMETAAWGWSKCSMTVIALSNFPQWLPWSLECQSAMAQYPDFFYMYQIWHFSYKMNNRLAMPPH